MSKNKTYQLVKDWPYTWVVETRRGAYKSWGPLTLFSTREGARAEARLYRSIGLEARVMKYAPFYGATGE